MPLVGFEPTIPAFERAKTVHALDRAATVIDIFIPTGYQIPVHSIILQNELFGLIAL
jgi:hypothetical protein